MKYLLIPFIALGVGSAAFAATPASHDKMEKAGKPATHHHMHHAAAKTDKADKPAKS